ncbi:MAG: protein kinase [Clostridia bacterium]|nr:protein kinase [Clostridia bacterium]
MNNKYQSFVGKVLDGRYKILELLGVGGMAFVLKAEDLLMDRTVAIKILNDEYNGDKQAESRFINESKAVAMLSHKNLVSIYDVAIYPDMKYIVMEYLDGITLKEYLDKKGVLPWKEACLYTMQILRALEHTHSRDVIHRDIKPQNIILQKNGEIKVTDFGIAKTPHEAVTSGRDRAIGTVYYISPEQASSKETTFASDLYSVGIMLYEMVTGVLPFTAENLLEIAMMQINDEPGNPCDITPDLPFGVAQIIRKAMEKNPSNRFSSAHSMIKAIDMVLRNPAVTFAMGNDYPAGEALPYNVVPIDSIATSEIDSYADENGAKPPVGGAGKKRYVKKRKKKKRSVRESRSLLPVIAAIALSFLLVCAFCGGYYAVYALKLTTGPATGNEVVVPKLVGQIWSEALSEKLVNGTYDSTGVKFKVLDIIEVYKSGYEDGEIIEQNPVAHHIGKLPDGQIFFEIDSIKINVVPDDVSVPYIRGYTYKEAEIRLKEMGFKVEKEVVYDEYGFSNQVVRTEPEFGALVSAGSTVKVFVSMGKDVTTALAVPNLKGMTLIEAQTALERANLALGEVTYEYDGEFTNEVINQSIKAGREGLEPFTKIDIVISDFLSALPPLLKRTNISRASS